MAVLEDIMRAETLAQSHVVTVEIGGMAIALESDDPGFQEMLMSRYAGFIRPGSKPRLKLFIDLVDPSSAMKSEDNVIVTRQGSEWLMQRGDFSARWNFATGVGQVRQSANPYAIDSVVRIVHSLILASEGGFLVHAASAIRNGRAFVFAGVSGAGKTTIARLAPPDARLLTDEISYVRREADHYLAFGTPFAGELAQLGENQRAPIAGLFLLAKGRENRIEEISKTEAVRSLLSNILFFAEDSELVARLFHAACAFVDKVPVRRLSFVPDQSVWDIID